MNGAASVYPNWTKMVLLINLHTVQEKFSKVTFLGSEGTMGDQQRPTHRTSKRKFYVEEISHQQFQRAPTPINHIADE